MVMNSCVYIIVKCKWYWETFSLSSLLSSLTPKLSEIGVYSILKYARKSSFTLLNLLIQTSSLRPEYCITTLKNKYK